jgi:hypothetical protein
MLVRWERIGFASSKHVQASRLINLNSLCITVRVHGLVTPSEYPVPVVHA